MPFTQNVGLYTDDTVLNKVWILNLYKNNERFNRGKCDLEFIAEVRYSHEPTKEEILYAMSAYGLERWDIAFVNEGYELGMEGD